MQRYFITFAYDGTNYCGWQRQPNGLAVQQVIEEAFSKVMRREVSVVGAGRTDSGVHARNMVLHVDLEESVSDPLRWIEKLNRLLPQDIALSDIRAVVPDAHARFDALSRTYHYYVGMEKDPFNRDFRLRVRKELDFKLMNDAAKLLLSITDFTSFSKLHTDVKTNNCDVRYAAWEPDEGGYRFVITADRFLRNMVRAIVGTLFNVGEGKIGLEDFLRIIDSKDRSLAGMSVPGYALFLDHIVYPEDKYL